MRCHNNKNPKKNETWYKILWFSSSRSKFIFIEFISHSMVECLTAHENHWTFITSRCIKYDKLMNFRYHWKYLIAIQILNITEMNAQMLNNKLKLRMRYKSAHRTIYVTVSNYCSVYRCNPSGVLNPITIWWDQVFGISDSHWSKWL